MVPHPGRGPDDHARVTLLDGDRRAHLLAAAAFGALLLVLFAPALADGRAVTATAAQQEYVYPWAATPHGYPPTVQSDQADLSMPALALQQRALDAGTLPYVDLFSYGGGTPLYADFSTAQAYPPRILVAGLLGPLEAHLAFIVLHLFGAGLFTYLLARSCGARWVTGVFAGSAWMLGSWSMGWMHAAPVVVTSALLPAGLWAMRRACRRPSLGSITVAGALVVAHVVAGHPLFGLTAVMITAVDGACVAVGEIRRGERERRDWRRWRPLLALPAAGGLGLLLWAAALVPLMAARGDSARSALTYHELTHGFVATGRDLLNPLWPYPAPLDLHEVNTLSFCGFLTAALAVVGLFTRRPGAGLGRGLVLVMLALMPGGPGTWLAYHLVPIMDLVRPYNRFALFLGFGVVMLAVAGLEGVLARLPAPAAAVRRIPLRPVAVALLVVAALASTAHLIRYGQDVNPEPPERDEASLFPDTSFGRALRAAAADTPNGWPGRAAVVSPKATPDTPWSPPVLWAAHGAYLGVETSSGYNSVMSRRAQRQVRVLSGEDMATVLARDSLGSFIPELWHGLVHDELFPRFGYDLVVTPPSLGPESAWGSAEVAAGRLTPVYVGPDGVVYRIVDAAAGPHGVAAIEVVDDDNDALARFTDGTFDAATTVLLSADDAADLTPAAGAALAPVEITDASRGTNGYRFTATTTASTLAVIPVNWGPGWSARAHGRSLPLVRGNYNQIVLEVPPGTSEIDLRFRPPGLTAGALVSGTTIAVVAGALATGAIRRRRPRPAPSPGMMAGQPPDEE